MAAILQSTGARPILLSSSSAGSTESEWTSPGIAVACSAHSKLQREMEPVKR